MNRIVLFASSLVMAASWSSHKSSSATWMMDYNDSVETEFQKLLSLLPPEMISHAYSVFIKVAGEDDYNSRRKEYQGCLRSEQLVWNEWMSYRHLVSQRLPRKLKVVYDKCTNQTMRTKLLQLKIRIKVWG